MNSEINAGEIASEVEVVKFSFFLSFVLPPESQLIVVFGLFKPVNEFSIFDYHITFIFSLRPRDFVASQN